MMPSESRPSSTRTIPDSKGALYDRRLAKPPAPTPSRRTTHTHAHTHTNKHTETKKNEIIESARKEDKRTLS